MPALPEPVALVADPVPELVQLTKAKFSAMKVTSTAYSMMHSFVTPLVRSDLRVPRDRVFDVVNQVISMALPTETSVASLEQTLVRRPLFQRHNGLLDAIDSGFSLVQHLFGVAAAVPLWFFLALCLVWFAFRLPFTLVAAVALSVYWRVLFATASDLWRTWRSHDWPAATYARDWLTRKLLHCWSVNWCVERGISPFVGLVVELFLGLTPVGCVVNASLELGSVVGCGPFTS
jgi:hypothetical protein